MPHSTNNKRNTTFTQFHTFSCKSAKYDEKGNHPTCRHETWSGYIRWLKLHQRTCDCVKPFHFRKREHNQGRPISHIPVMRGGIQVGSRCVEGIHHSSTNLNAFINADTGLVHNSIMGKRVKPVRNPNP